MNLHNFQDTTSNSAEQSDWRAHIRGILTDIDTDSRLTADDKKLLKRFYFEKCLPPSIQDGIRKYFPEEFNGTESVSAQLVIPFEDEIV